MLGRRLLDAEGEPAVVYLAGLLVDDLHLGRAQRVVQQPALGGGERPRRQRPLDLLDRQAALAQPLGEEALPRDVALPDLRIHGKDLPNPKLKGLAPGRTGRAARRNPYACGGPPGCPSWWV